MHRYNYHDLNSDYSSIDVRENALVHTTKYIQDIFRESDIYIM